MWTANAKQEGELQSSKLQEIPAKIIQAIRFIETNVHKIIPYLQPRGPHHTIM